MKHHVVTTFHKAGYELYGRKCIESFVQYWPSSVTLIVYAEGVGVEAPAPNVIVHDQEKTLPSLVAHKNRFQYAPFMNGCCPWRKTKKGYFWEAVRFANKVFAVTDCIRRSTGIADQLIWLDADTVTRKAMNIDFIDSLCPTGSQLVAFLNRSIFPECGWVGYNLNHPEILKFADEFENLYATGAVEYFRESHDSYVFSRLVNKYVREYGATFLPLGDDTSRGHVFLNSVLGEYIDHLKGPDRKLHGSSRLDDVEGKSSADVEIRDWLAK